MTDIDFNQWFCYDENSPSALSRATDWVSGKNGSIIRGFAGDHCTSKTSNGKYYDVFCKGRLYKAHRVVWQILKGDIPDGMTIDHIDLNSLNNKIENLRCVTQQINNRNKPRLSSNKSGVTGVYLLKRVNASWRWVSKWCEKGKEFTRSFSVKTYGFDIAFELACEYRKNQIYRMNTNGEGYSDIHGK